MGAESGNQTSCGTCTVCCLVLRIEEFDKPAGTLCQHCTGQGCGIHETRYDVCRGFFCGYRLVPELGEDWRPDRNGVLIVILVGEDVPEDYRAAGNAMHFTIVGGENAILRPGFAEYVMTLVSRRVAVFLSADSPKTLINPYLEKLVADKDQEGVVHMLVHIYRKHMVFRDMKKWKPMPWVDIP